MFVYPTCFTLPFYTLFMSRLLNSTTRAGRMGESQSSGATRSRRKGSRRISGTRCACARDSMSARALTRAAITSNAQSSARVRGPRGRCPQYPQCQGSQSEIKHTDTAPTLALCLCVLWYIYIYMSMKHGDVSKGLAEASEHAAPMFIYRIPVRTTSTCSCTYLLYTSIQVLLHS